MFKVTMRHDWHDGVQFGFDDLGDVRDFMQYAFDTFKPLDGDDELKFIIEKKKEEAEDAETVCGTEED